MRGWFAQETGVTLQIRNLSEELQNGSYDGRRA
jgi:hypothetical protein